MCPEGLLAARARAKVMNPTRPAYMDKIRMILLAVPICWLSPVDSPTVA